MGCEVNVRVYHLRSFVRTMETGIVDKRLDIMVISSHARLGAKPILVIRPSKKGSLLLAPLTTLRKRKEYLGQPALTIATTHTEDRLLYHCLSPGHHPTKNSGVWSLCGVRILGYKVIFAGR